MHVPRILVVEDEPIVALHLRQLLTKLGYDVPDAVSTGEQALRGIEASRPDLVLMDINIKGDMDGIATASRISPALHIPVIYLTAYSEEATLVRAGATKPYGYLLKPFSERELHAMIQVTLARCRAERASLAALECRHQAQKMEALGQLAGGVADDFNDLLTVVYDQLELLGDPTLDRQAMSDPIQDGFRDAIEKEQLLERLLAFSGRQKLTHAAVSLKDLVTGASGELRRTLGVSNELRLILPDGVRKAWIDGGQLTRALVDLAANASEAMPDGGSLTIELRNTVLEPDDADGPVAAGRYVLLIVADTGTGMPDHVIERAFEPFFTTKRAGGGTGLGLSLVFGFIRQSGGHISIDSQPGSGTTVRIYVPAIADTALSSDDETPPVRTIADPSASPAADGPMPNAARRNRSTAEIRGWSDHDPFQRGESVATPDDGPLPVSWRKTDNVLFAAIRSGTGAVRYHLIVEPLPRRNGWDWAAWRPDDTEKASRHGRASSVVSAMAAAEDAAGHWDANLPPEL